MEYQSLYRKYRPKTFGEMVGQDHLTKTLLNAIRKKKVNHAYLFTGTRGTGKTTAAKILSKAVNCLTPKDGEPCNRCVICKSIDEGRTMDVIEIDAASNRGIDEIRDLRENVKYLPSECRKKVYIIDEVHMLTNEAFNALLKTLEEPPEHVIFVMATTEPQKVPATILSRCQRFDLKRIEEEALVLYMKKILSLEGAEAEEDALHFIAHKAEGSMRDCLSILEQVLILGGEHITKQEALDIFGTVDDSLLLQFADGVLYGDYSSILSVIKQGLERGKAVVSFIGDLLGHYRNLLLLKSEGDKMVLWETSAAQQERLKAQSKAYSYEKLFFAIETLSEAEREARFALQPRLILEVAGLKLSHPSFAASYESILAQLEDMRQELTDLKEKGIVFSQKEEKEAPLGSAAEEKRQTKQPVSVKEAKQAEAEDNETEKDEKKEGTPAEKPQEKEADKAEALEKKILDGWDDILSLCKKKNMPYMLRFIKEGLKPVSYRDNVLYFEAKSKEIGTVQRIEGLFEEKETKEIFGQAFLAVCKMEMPHFKLGYGRGKAEKIKTEGPKEDEGFDREKQLSLAKELFPDTKIEVL